MAKTKRKWIDLNYSSPTSLRAQDIPYNELLSIKAKIDSIVSGDGGIVEWSPETSYEGEIVVLHERKLYWIPIAYISSINFETDLTNNNLYLIGGEDQIQSDWLEEDYEALSYIQNKPYIPTNTSDLTNDSNYIDKETADEYYVLEEDFEYHIQDSSIHFTQEEIQIDASQVSNLPNGTQSDWLEEDYEALSYIQNKPSIPTNTSDLTNDSNYIDKETADEYYVLEEDFEYHTLDTTIHFTQEEIDHNNVLNKNLGDSHPSTAISYDNTDSNLIATNVKEAIDELGMGKTDFEYHSLDTTIHFTQESIQIDASQVDNIPPQVQSDWNEEDYEALSYIQNKPSIPTNVSDLINDSNYIDKETADDYYVLEEDFEYHTLDSSIHFTQEEIDHNQLANINVDDAHKSFAISYDNTNSSLSATNVGEGLDELNNTKVDKEVGKQLSTEDYTTNEKNKLSNIEVGANNYIHPLNHLPSIITQDENNRFVTDVEKSTWNGKQDSLIGTNNRIYRRNNDGLVQTGNIRETDNGFVGIGVDPNTGVSLTVGTEYITDRLGIGTPPHASIPLSIESTQPNCLSIISNDSTDQWKKVFNVTAPNVANGHKVQFIFGKEGAAGRVAEFTYFNEVNVDDCAIQIGLWGAHLLKMYNNKRIEFDVDNANGHFLINGMKTTNEIPNLYIDSSGSVLKSNYVFDPSDNYLSNIQKFSSTTFVYYVGDKSVDWKVNRYDSAGTKTSAEGTGIRPTTLSECEALTYS